ncbi:hypothetical protein HK100_009392, partial [Physocladia obscura]
MLGFPLVKSDKEKHFVGKFGIQALPTLQEFRSKLNSTDWKIDAATETIFQLYEVMREYTKRENDRNIWKGIAFIQTKDELRSWKQLDQIFLSNQKTYSEVVYYVDFTDYEKNCLRDLGAHEEPSIDQLIEVISQFKPENPPLCNEESYFLALQEIHKSSADMCAAWVVDAEKKFTLAQDCYVNDNPEFAKLFDVVCAPAGLEQLYMKLGCKKLNSAVRVEVNPGIITRSELWTHKLKHRIQLLANSNSHKDLKNLTVFE